MLQAARFKAFEQVLQSPLFPAPQAQAYDLHQVFGRPVTGLWAALHLLLKLLPDHVTDVLGYLSRVRIALRPPAPALSCSRTGAGTLWRRRSGRSHIVCPVLRPLRLCNTLLMLGSPLDMDTLCSRMHTVGAWSSHLGTALIIQHAGLLRRTRLFSYVTSEGVIDRSPLQRPHQDYKPFICFAALLCG
jgi:hypothetical protein